MKNLREPITTLLGAGLLIISAVLVITGKATIAETAGWGAMGMLLLRVNDKILK